MAAIKSLKSLVLDLPPSCVEFWPLHPEYAVVGTYNLERSPTDGASDEGASVQIETRRPQERNGSIILLRVDGDQVNIAHTFTTPFAVLDIHFAPQTHSPSLFGVASSTGSIGLYQLTDPLDPNIGQFALPEIIHIQTISLADPVTLVTAFAWHPKPSGLEGKSLLACISLTDGTIAIEEIPSVPTVTDRTSESIGCHDLEAWTLAFTHDGAGVYSGGDDSVLGFWDLARHSHELWTNAPSSEAGGSIEWKDRKIHGAGVTAILPLRTTGSESLIVTGSYDDNIRLISVSTMGRRKVLAETNLGGGVWRLKQLNKTGEITSTPEENQQPLSILASCMHAGARVLRLLRDDDGEWRFEVLGKFEEHKSMNYGSDCQPCQEENGQRTFITTSFYDRLLCLWRH